jgi:putative serine protease PepD
MTSTTNHSTTRLMLAAAVLSAFVGVGSTLAVVTLAPRTVAPASVAAATPNAAALSATATIRDDATIAAAAKASVVTITTSAGRVSGVGSGVILTSDGLILTNDHVVAGSSSLSVALLDGRDLPATVVTEDAAGDLAVIKVTATGLTPAQLGQSSAVQVGETVLAIGSPLGTYTDTVTRGIVSGTDREITVRSETTRRPIQLSGLIQTDAAINPGNSGGPLIDEAGDVIAIATATSSDAQGLGFAIPIDAAKAIIAQAEGAA